MPARKRAPFVKRTAAVLAVAAVAITLSGLMVARRDHANAGGVAVTPAARTEAPSAPEVATPPLVVVDPAPARSDAPPAASASSVPLVRGASSPKTDARRRPRPVDAGPPGASSGASAAGDPGLLDLLNRH